MRRSAVANARKAQGSQGTPSPYDRRFGRDEHGIKAVENKVHQHDLQATLLHLMGLDHEKLTYRYGGRDYKLTGVGGARVVEDVMA